MINALAIALTALIFFALLLLVREVIGFDNTVLGGLAFLWAVSRPFIAEELDGKG